MWKSCIRDLRRQHDADLKVYRLAHQEWRNRVIHWVMIPIECWSAFLLVVVIVPPFVFVSIGLGLGVVALLISTNENVGWYCLLFHIAAVGSCLAITQLLCVLQTVSLGFISWTIAWLCQVGIGHRLWENNRPNVADIHTVSFLAMIESVLIAWSS